jgi:methyl-accepting chemotaxis protein
VTPLLLLWFCLSLALYSGQLVWLKTSAWSFYQVTKGKWIPPFLRTDIDAFPFYQNHEAIFVQFGFIGTIWGFLIVGWNMGLTSGESAKKLDIVDTLMRAFGTALLSTFTAVVLVYVIIPMTQSLFRGLIGLPESFTPDENMKRFNDSVSQTRIGVDTFKSTMESFTDTLCDITPQISETLANAVSKTLITVGKRDTAKQDELIKVLQELKMEQGKKQDAIIDHIKDMNRKLDELTSLLQKGNKVLPEKFEKVYTAICEQTQKIEQGNTMLPAKLGEIRVAIREQTELMQKKSEELFGNMQQNQQMLQTNHRYLERLMSYFSEIFKGFKKE